MEKEFYNKSVIEYYIKKVNYEKGGAWKGVFLKKELIAQMLAIIENKHVTLKLTMIKEKYRNLGLMKLLSISMIKEIDNYSIVDFKSIFAFVSPKNLPILKILHQFKFREVGAVPPYDIGEDFIIYYKSSFNRDKLTKVKPHYRLLKDIKKDIKRLDIPRKIIKCEVSRNILVNNKIYKINIVKNPDIFPIKYYIYENLDIVGEYLENIYNHTWYSFKLKHDISLELKDIILRKIIAEFKSKSTINAFSIIVEIDEIEIQGILLDLDFKYYAYLPLYFGNKDCILLGISKIR